MKLKKDPNLGILLSAKSPRMSAMSTSAPCLAESPAADLPIPLAAPVTKPTLSSSLEQEIQVLSLYPDI